MNPKEKKSVRVQNKTAQFMFKTSPELIEILNDLAEKKGMSKGGIIEYLLRREHDFLTNPVFNKKPTYTPTPAEKVRLEKALKQMEEGIFYTEEEEVEAEIDKLLWEE